MKTKILALCLAILGLVGFVAPAAQAHDTATAQKTAQAIAALPATARVNALVEVRTGGRRDYHRPRYRTVRRVYYRHGRRVVVVRRVRY